PVSGGPLDRGSRWSEPIRHPGDRGRGRSGVPSGTAELAQFGENGYRCARGSERAGGDMSVRLRSAAQANPYAPSSTPRTDGGLAMAMAMDEGAGPPLRAVTSDQGQASGGPVMLADRASRDITPPDLPVWLTSFVGRAKEIAEARHLLGS